MRLRLAELLKARGLTAYALAQRSGGRLSNSFVYRIVREGGDFQCLSPGQLEALCEVLECQPGELFAREKPRRVRR